MRFQILNYRNVAQFMDKTNVSNYNESPSSFKINRLRHIKFVILFTCQLFAHENGIFIINTSVQNEVISKVRNQIN